MLSDIIFSLPDGRDAVVRLDTTLDKNEIRVGSLGALDQFMSDASKTQRPITRRNGTRRATIRLSNSQITGIRKWLWEDKNFDKLNQEQKQIMEHFFPKGKEGMVSSKILETSKPLDGITAARARSVRNGLMRKVGLRP